MRSVEGRRVADTAMRGDGTCTGVRGVEVKGEGIGGGA